MKIIINTLSVFLFAASLFSCAGLKATKTISPVGDWNYSVTDTPQGDVSGILTINLSNKIYAGALNTNGQQFVFTTAKYNSETKKFEAAFDYNGMPIDLAATMTGNEMIGIASAGSGYEFPFKATRKQVK